MTTPDQEKLKQEGVPAAPQDQHTDQTNNPNMFDEQGRPRFDEHGKPIHYRIVTAHVGFKGVGKLS